MAKETPYVLKTPVQFADETVSRVTITRKGKFLKGTHIKTGVQEQKNSQEMLIYLEPSQNIDLAARMIGYLPEIFDEMDDEDRSFIVGEAQSFLLSTLGTGAAATPS
jgi:hypothetical protein